MSEFLHVELEQYFITFEDLLDGAEILVKSAIRVTLERCASQYDFFESKQAPASHHGHRDFLESLLDKPFHRIRDKVKHI